MFEYSFTKSAELRFVDAGFLEPQQMYSSSRFDINDPEVQKFMSERPMSEKHIRDLMEGSGLTLATIKELRLKTITNPSHAIQILNWQNSSTKLILKMGQFLAFPYFEDDNEAPKYVRLKPDNPRTSEDKIEEGKIGKVVKYESPKGSSNRAYIVPALRPYLDDHVSPLFITEGEKKAAKAIQEGFPTIGLVGVYGFQKKRKKDENGQKTGDRELIDDLAGIMWENRDVFICYDSDAVTNDNVRKAECHLAETLKRHGARVKIIRLPATTSGAKQGLDDYLVANSPEAFDALICAAEAPQQPEFSNDSGSDPYVLATKFLEKEYPKRNLRTWNSEFVEWNDGGYRFLPLTEIDAPLRIWMRAEFVHQNIIAMRVFNEGSGQGKPPVTTKVTNNLMANVIGAIKAITRIPAEITPPCWIDDSRGLSPIGLLPMQNGILDLASGNIQCVTPTFFTFNALPYDFLQDSRKPEKWFEFLNQLWPNDHETIACLQEWFGYLLTPDTRQQKILFFIGPKRSGKGTIFRILKELVGPSNCCGPTLSSLTTNFGLQPLLGKSVALVSDARLSSRLDAATMTERLLSISGEDSLSVDRKHKEPITVKLMTRFVMASNELPQIHDSSGALANRFILLQLKRSFYGCENHDLTGQLLQELPGILIWAITGWKRLQERGRFLEPSSGRALLNEMEDLSSPVGAFVRECCIRNPSAQVEVKLLYRRWREWCQHQGINCPGSEQKFGKDLRSVIPELDDRRPKKDGVRWREYVGVGLITDVTPEHNNAKVNPITQGDSGSEGPRGSAGQTNAAAISKVAMKVSINTEEAAMNLAADPRGPSDPTPAMQIDPWNDFKTFKEAMQNKNLTFADVLKWLGEPRNTTFVRLSSDQKHKAYRVLFSCVE